VCAWREHSGSKLSPNEVTTMTRIRTLFLDIGNVILSNGWDHNLRRNTAELFNIDFTSMDERHHLTYDTYEEGKLSFDEYLDRVIFFKPRAFSKHVIKDFIFSQSRPCPEMISMFEELKASYGLQVVAVSNEGRELMEYRIQHFGLASWMDAFIGSCFVHIRKPDLDIFRLALDVTQTPPHEVLYLDDRALFIEVAATLGIQGIVHRSYASTLAALAAIGLSPAPEPMGADQA
jgi:putative hydrolase of the HAD superfamily